MGTVKRKTSIRYATRYCNESCWKESSEGVALCASLSFGGSWSCGFWLCEVGWCWKNRVMRSTEVTVWRLEMARVFEIFASKRALPCDHEKWAMSALRVLLEIIWERREKKCGAPQSTRKQVVQARFNHPQVLEEDFAMRALRALLEVLRERADYYFFPRR